MQDLVGTHRYPVFMNASSMLCILAGLALYWFSSNGLSAAWITSGPGLGFTLGSLATLAAFGIGFFGIRPRAERMGAVGAAIARPAARPRRSRARNWAGWKRRCTPTNAGTWACWCSPWR